MIAEPAAATRHTSTYPGRADQVHHVRRAIARHLAGCPAANDAVLIASELAANAILHSRSRAEHFTLRAELHPIMYGSRPKTLAAPGAAGSPAAARTAWTWWRPSPARTTGVPRPPPTAAASSGPASTCRRGSEPA